MEKKPLEIRYFNPEAVSMTDYIRDNQLDNNPIMPMAWNLTWMLSEHFRDTVQVLENNSNVSSVRILARMNEQWCDNDEYGIHYNFDTAILDGEERRVAVFGFDLIGLSPDARKSWAETSQADIRRVSGVELFGLEAADDREHFTVFMPRLGELSKTNRQKRLKYLKDLASVFLELRIAIADSGRYIKGPTHRSTMGGVAYPFEGADSDHVDVLVVGSEDWVAGNDEINYVVTGGRFANLDEITEVAESMNLNGYHLSHIAVFNKQAWLDHQLSQEEARANRHFDFWTSGDGSGQFSCFVGSGKGRTLVEAVAKMVEEERKYVPLNGYSWDLDSDEAGVYGTFKGHRVFGTHAEAVNHLLNKIAKEAYEPRKFNLWVEGYQATGNSAGATFVAVISGLDFNTAIAAYVKTLAPDAASYWSFSPMQGCWTHWACRAYDNEADARRAYG